MTPNKPKHGGPGRGQGRKPQGGRKNPTRSFSLPQEVLDAIHAEAARTGTTASAVVASKFKPNANSAGDPPTNDSTEAKK